MKHEASKASCSLTNATLRPLLQLSVTQGCFLIAEFIHNFDGTGTEIFLISPEWLGNSDMIEVRTH